MKRLTLANWKRCLFQKIRLQKFEKRKSDKFLNFKLFAALIFPQKRLKPTAFFGTAAVDGCLKSAVDCSKYIQTEI